MNCGLFAVEPMSVGMTWPKAIFAWGSESLKDHTRPHTPETRGWYFRFSFGLSIGAVEFLLVERDLRQFPPPSLELEPLEVTARVLGPARAVDWAAGLFSRRVLWCLSTVNWERRKEWVG